MTFWEISCYSAGENVEEHTCQVPGSWISGLFSREGSSGQGICTLEGWLDPKLEKPNKYCGVGIQLLDPRNFMGLFFMTSNSCYCSAWNKIEIAAAITEVIKRPIPGVMHQGSVDTLYEIYGFFEGVFLSSPEI